MAATIRRTFQGCTLAQTLALFLQKSFRVLGGQKLGIDELNRKRRELLVGMAYPTAINCPKCGKPAHLEHTETLWYLKASDNSLDSKAPKMGNWTRIKCASCGFGFNPQWTSQANQQN